MAPVAQDGYYWVLLGSDGSHGSCHSLLVQWILMGPDKNTKDPIAHDGYSTGSFPPLLHYPQSLIS
jgi:hypothetical protein